MPDIAMPEHAEFVGQHGRHHESISASPDAAKALGERRAAASYGRKRKCAQSS